METDHKHTSTLFMKYVHMLTNTNMWSMRTFADVFYRFNEVKIMHR